MTGLVIYYLCAHFPAQVNLNTQNSPDLLPKVGSLIKKDYKPLSLFIANVTPTVELNALAMKMSEAATYTFLEPAPTVPSASPAIGRHHPQANVISHPLIQHNQRYQTNLHKMFTGLFICQETGVGLSLILIVPVLLGLMRIGQKWLGKMMEHPNQSQPNPGLGADESPCIQLQFLFETKLCNSQVEE